MNRFFISTISLSALLAGFCMAWTPVEPWSRLQNSSWRIRSKSLARAQSHRCYFHYHQQQEQRLSTSGEGDDVEMKPLIVNLPRINGHVEQDNSFPNILPELQISHGNDDVVDDDKLFRPELLWAGAIVVLVAVVASLSTTTALQQPSSMEAAADLLKDMVQNPSLVLDNVVKSVESMGPMGAFYFGVAYTVAEVFAIPAFPLTASAGYLFGPVEGTAVVLFSASIAAAISFVIGRTLLREYVVKLLENYPKFAKLDRAIGKEGFKLMLVLRLSPIFPFALSNYLYGASSINFPAFFWGTLLGFAPGTLAYVCTGAFGKTLASDGIDDTHPWFVYAGGFVILAGTLSFLASTAGRIIEEMEDEEGANGMVGR